MKENLEGLSRRTFLKGAGILAASVVIPSEIFGAETFYRNSQKYANAEKKILEEKKEILAQRIYSSSNNEDLNKEVFRTAMRMLTQKNPPYAIPYRDKKYSLQETFSRITQFRDYIEQNSYVNLGRGNMSIKNLSNSLIAQESGGDVRATSSSNAKGLTQLIPETARDLGMRVDKYIDHRLDPELSIEKGIEYLKRQIIEFNDNAVLSLIAYNAGPSVARNLEKRGFSWSRMKTHLPDRNQTGGFVEKILAMKAMLDTGIIIPINLPLHSQYVMQNCYTGYVEGIINLREIAEKSKINFYRTKFFNPHFLADRIDTKRKSERIRVPYI